MPSWVILRRVLQVIVSHRTSELCEAFTQRIDAERTTRGPLSPIHIVVPNRNVQTYLQHKVAEKLGIAAHLDFTFLHRHLAGLQPSRQVLDAAVIKQQLLALFYQAIALTRPEMVPVQRYLDGGGEDEDGRDLRRLELAEHLAKLFDEYALSRAPLLHSWETGTPDDWQGHLWQMLRNPQNFGLPQLFQSTWTLESLVKDAISQTSVSYPPLHVFGLSYFAQAYHRMLEMLAGCSEVHLYLQIPCQETESNLRLPGKGPASDPFELLTGKTAAALWGRPSRENLRLLLAGSKTQYHPLAFSPSSETTLLGRLQNEIALHHAPKPMMGLDESISVFPCPSLRREIEVIAAEIWRRLERDETLRLSDILVVVPEANKALYLNLIPLVFRESSALPHNLSDLPIANRHPVVHALSLLLNLPFLPLTRKSILPLITHPNVAGRFSELDPSQFAEMLARLGIVREANREDLPYLDRDLFSFDQGWRRMALGVCFDDSDEVWLNGEPYAPAQLTPDRMDFSKLCLLCCSLVADARFARGLTGKMTRPLDQWLDFIVGMVHGYIHLDENDQQGITIVRRFLSELIKLRDQGLGTTNVRFRIAAQLAQQTLDALPWSPGQYLANGVTVASFVPMRSIPFRAVFVLGLSQGQFPQQPGLHELDRRKASRQLGDVDPSEQDLNLFLETLLSTQDYLGLSYVARDEVTGDPKAPSQVLWDLRALLGHGHLSPPELSQLFCDDRKDCPPLCRYDDVGRRVFLSEAVAEHQVVEMGRTISAKGSITSTLEGLPQDKAHILSELLSIPLPSRQRPLPPVHSFTVTLEDLFRFLVDPLQGSARFNLGLHSEWEDDPADVEDEPFDVEKHTLRNIVERCTVEGLLNTQSVPSSKILRQIVEKTVRHELLCGRLPGGLLGRRLPSLAHQACDAISTILQNESITACNEVHLAHGESSPPTRYLPSLYTSVPFAQGQTSLTLQGPVGLILTARTGVTLSLAVASRPPPSRNGIDQTDLRAFLNHLILSARDVSKHPHDSLTIYLEKDQCIERRHRFASVTPQIAQDYLLGLCTELCLGGIHGSSIHPYLFPYEAVLQSQVNGTSVSTEIRHLLEKAEDHDRLIISSERGGVPDALDQYGPPDEVHAHTLRKTRFELFFKLCDPLVTGSS